MSQNLTTFQPLPHKIKIPRTAASYTSATMDQNLRSQINIQLVANGHDKKYAALPPSITCRPHEATNDDSERRTVLVGIIR